MKDSPGHSNRIRNSGPCQTSRWYPSTEKKMRHQCYGYIWGFNFSLGRKDSLAHGRDLILLNFIGHCIGHCNWYTLWNPICRAWLDSRCIVFICPPSHTHFSQSLPIAPLSGQWAIATSLPGCSCLDQGRHLSWANQLLFPKNLEGDSDIPVS